VLEDLELHHRWLGEAIALAELARARGDHPFGALVVRGTEAVAREGNTVVTGGDVTGHAELNAVRALERLGIADRGELILYASTEPCPMCCGAIYWARIRRVVFGCSAEALARLAGPGFSISARALLAHAAHPTAVLGPLLEEQAVAVHSDYW
jgi:tRNA(Arg) A34 adenosine deaminase TadA